MLIPFSRLVSEHHLSVKGIIHVGSHELEELEAYNQQGVDDSNILWLDANKQVTQKMQQLHPGKHVHNVVLSDVDGQKCEFILTNNPQSNSILELEEHKKDYDWCREIGREVVITKRLDTWMTDMKIPIEKFNFLNCDTQGSELKVLKGMGNMLAKFDYLYLEVNWVHMYKDCPLVDEIDAYVKQYGFVRIQTVQVDTGHWGDALYVKI